MVTYFSQIEKKQLMKNTLVLDADNKDKHGVLSSDHPIHTYLCVV